MSDAVVSEAERAVLRAHYKVVIRKGLVAALLLAVLSVIEYVLAQEIDNPTWYMVPFMFAKGIVILDVFMHVRALRGEGSH
jgi:hypothetical protein